MTAVWLPLSCYHSLCVVCLGFSSLRIQRDWLKLIDWNRNKMFEGKIPCDQNWVKLLLAFSGLISIGNNVINIPHSFWSWWTFLNFTKYALTEMDVIYTLFCGSHQFKNYSAYHLNTPEKKGKIGTFSYRQQAILHNSIFKVIQRKW